MKTKSFKLGIIFCVFVLFMAFNLPATAEDISTDIVKIDINTATKEQLQSLSGIGESYADRIIEYRQNNGPFQTKEDIMKVKGIGEKIYHKIEDLIIVKTE